MRRPDTKTPILKTSTQGFAVLLGFCLATSACGDDGDSGGSGTGGTGAVTGADDGEPGSTSGQATLDGTTTGGGSASSTATEDASATGSDSGDDSSGETGDPARCGDGVVEGLEQCDGEEDCLETCNYPPNFVFWDALIEGLEPKRDARVWGVGFDSAERPVFGGWRYVAIHGGFAEVRERDGTEVWSNVFPSELPTSSFVGSIAVTTDDRIVLLGSADQPYASAFDSDGTALWDRVLSPSDPGDYWEAVPVSDGGLVVVSTRVPLRGGPRYVMLTRLDANGQAEWDVPVLEREDVSVESWRAAPAPDGGVYVLAATVEVPSTLLARINADGTTAWEVEDLPGYARTIIGGVAQTASGSALIALAKTEQLSNPEQGVRIVELGADGQQVDAFEVEDSDAVMPQAVAVTPQGSTVVCGVRRVAAVESELWYGVLEADGSTRWSDVVPALGPSSAGGTHAQCTALAIDSHGIALMGGTRTTDDFNEGEASGIRGFVRMFAP